MSRSFKKSPAWTDHRTPGTRWRKRQASKAVRRFVSDVQNGKWFRKMYCSWNICDHRFFKTRQQAIHEWETEPWRWRWSQTQEEALMDWEKMYRRK